MSSLEFYNMAVVWLNIFSDVAVKGTLILLPAILAVSLRKRLSAEMKHLILFLSICSLIILPVFFQITDAMKLAHPMEITSVQSIADKAGGKINEETQSKSNTEVSAGTGIRDLKRLELSDSSFKVNWLAYVFFIWLSGFLAALFRLVLGHYGVKSLRKMSVELPEMDCHELISDIRREIKLKRQVRLYFCDHGLSPVTCGILHPAVILPCEAEGWSRERLKVVLMHELFHIKRQDNLTQLVAQLVCAVYWFNPFVWGAVRKLRSERENACDDRVLGMGVRSAEYASQLLDIARNFSYPRAPAILTSSIAPVSNVESRIRYILNAKMRRNCIGTGKKVLFATVLLFILIPASLVNIYAFGVAHTGSNPVVSINSNNYITILDSKQGIEAKNLFPRDIPALWPFEYLDKSIESSYGSLKSEETGSISVNKGVDFDTRDGNVCMLAAADGVVKEISNSSKYGKYMIVSHKSGFYSIYTNMEEAFHKPGDSVSMGEIIGVSDKSRIVHYEVRYGSKAINPIPLINKQAEIWKAEKRLKKCMGE